MLTISTIKNTQGATKYFSQEDNYYLAEAHAHEHSMWYGRGATELQLSGKVAKQDLAKLFSGELPNGKKISPGPGNKHRAGYNLCFSAPKSVSILALAGEDIRFYQAHLEAVKETLSVIERDFACAKVYKANTELENTKNLIIALIRHTTSREQDPQLHHHALVMNATKRSDGFWSALASTKSSNRSSNNNGFSEKIYHQQVLYGLIYRNILAHKVKELGCEIEVIGTHGLWEIKGIPQNTLDNMSKRRAQIEQSVAESGNDSLKAMDIAALSTRKHKRKLDWGKIRQKWHEEIAATGFNTEKFISGLSKDKNLPINPGAKQLVLDAVDHLSQYSMKLDYTKIMAKSLELAMDKYQHQTLVKALDQLIQEEALIPLDKSSSTFVTKKLIATEKTIMSMVKPGASYSYNNDHELAANILCSANRLNLVEHKLSNNLELNQELLKLTEQSGQTLRILVPNRAMANDINTTCKRKLSLKNLWRSLANKLPATSESIASFKYKYPENCSKQDIIVIDRAESISCNDLLDILQLTEKTQAKVIFLQDLDTRTNMASNPIATLKQAGIETFKINTEPILETVPQIQGIKDDTERIQTVAHNYALNPNTLVITTKNNIPNLTHAIREELKNQGKLARDEYQVSVLTPVHLSKAEGKFAHRYRSNMLIRIYQEDKSYQDWNIERINIKGNLLQLTHEGKIKVVAPKDIAKHQIFSSETLVLAAGDKVITTANMPMDDITSNSKFTVKAINAKTIKLTSPKNNITLDRTEPIYLQHDYATTLNKSLKKENQVIADLKAYLLDKPTLNELSLLAKQITICTDNIDVAQKKLKHLPIKFTAMDEANKAAIVKYLSPAHEAVDFAITKLSSRNTGFTHNSIVQEALKYGFTNITSEEINTAITDNIQSGELIAGRQAAYKDLYTTKELLKQELTILEHLKLAEPVAPFLSQQQVDAALIATNLTQDQKDACKLVATTKDQFVIIQGYAGTGKTTMFCQLQKMLTKQTKILAVAPTHRAVKELQVRGIPAQTLKSFLGNAKPVDLLILDEASMMPNSDFLEFLKLVDPKTHVVFSGDVAQLPSPSSGKPFELTQQANILNIAYLREIIRQNNQVLKKTVQNIIAKKLPEALAKIEVIAGDKKQDLVQDFITKSKKERENTIIIAHTHEDRDEITKLLRQELKTEKTINEQGLEVNCLKSKRFTDIEHKFIQSYALGDVIKIGKKYYKVADINKTTKSILLQDEQGKTKYLYPEKYNSKIPVELYCRDKKELAAGDIVRFTKTDKEQERYANFKYTVKSINQDQIVLSSHKNNNQQEIILNPKNLRDVHLDYAYAVTCYGAQGASKKNVINYQLSFRQNLTNWYSMYVAISRATENAKIYTDDKKKLISGISERSDNKYIACEIAGISYDSNSISNSTNASCYSRANFTNAKVLEYCDATELQDKLAAIATSATIRLLGEPNKNLSTSTQLRYGNKGSLVITIAGEYTGLWHNFETGESGNMLSLIQKETGLTFRKSLEYANDLLGGSILSSGNKTKPELKNINQNSKTAQYAKQLIAESKPIAGTIVATYLKARGITNIDTTEIRYHPKVYTSNNESQKYCPAMLAIARDKDGIIQGVQATYLNSLTATKADLAITKRTYGSLAKATVLLPGSTVTNNIHIAEGIETGLSVRDATKGNVLVTLGKANFANIDPEFIGKKTAVLCLDNDGSKTFTDKIITKAAQRLLTYNKQVELVLPEQIKNSKTDFNDIARTHGVSGVSAQLKSNIKFSTGMDNIGSAKHKNLELEI